jgi:hypothetical protein
LIGRSLVWYPAVQPADNTLSGVVVSGFFAMAMVAVWLVAWRTRRRERKWLEQMESPPDFDSGVELDRMDQHTESAPDFSRLAEMDRGPEPKPQEPPE